MAQNDKRRNVVTYGHDGAGVMPELPWPLALLGNALFRARLMVGTQRILEGDDQAGELLKEQLRHADTFDQN